MKNLIVAVVVIIVAGGALSGIYLQRSRSEKNLSPQEIEFILREMRPEEATATTTDAIERRLRLASAIAGEGETISVTGCVARPLVLEAKRDQEVIFENRGPQHLLLLIVGDYYRIPSKGTLTLKADFKIENDDNLIRYVCGEGGGAPTFHGFILVE